MRYRRRSYRDHEDDDLDLIGDNLESLTDRLDDLARQVARLARRREEREIQDDTDEAPERPVRRRYEVAEDRPAPRANNKPSRDDGLHPVPNWLPETDSENGNNSISPQAPEAASPAPEPAPALVQMLDLSGLESQLRQITEQIAELHQPCRIDDAVMALRNDLAEVSRAFNEAMPRQAIEVLEKEIRGLAERVDRSWEEGAGVAKFAQLEHGLVEVRDTLRNLKPAEYLVEITQAVRHLAHRIDQVAAATQNPAALQKLDQAIGGLRTIVSHVASNDTVGKIAEEIRGLSSRFEHAIAENSAKTQSSLDRQISTLIESSRAVSPELKALIENNRSVSPELRAFIESNRGVSPELRALIESTRGISPELKALIESNRGVSPELRSLIESSKSVSPELKSMIMSIGERVNQTQPNQAQLSNGDQLALSSIEERIVKLSEKLDDSDTVLARLSTIEQGVGDLLVHLEEQQKSPPPEAHHPHMNGGTAEPIHTEETAEQTAEEPQAPAPQPEFIPPATTHFIPPQPTYSPRMEAVAAAPSPNLVPNSSFSVTTMPSHMDEVNDVTAEMKTEPLIAQMRRAINPDLPPDTPIEPSPEPAQLRASAAERITASEAALGPAKPAAREVATQFETLIAARRAAFAASAETAAASVTPFKPVLAEGAEQNSPKKSLRSYIRMVLVAASVIAILLYALSMGWDMWKGQAPSTFSPEQSNMPVPALPPVSPQAPNAIDQASPPSAMPEPVKPVAPMPMPAPESGPMPPVQDSPPASPPNGSSPDPLGDSGINKTMPEVTGALSKADPRVTADLPVTIGGPMLRSAAVAADPAAEYEIAVRYIEGRGVTANVEEAARWLERSAKSGFAPALFRLGGLYDKGGGLKKDRALARQLYTAAAEKGHAKAMHNLAVLYAEGFDGKPNYRLAAMWFRKAADYGIADSQYNLAILYIRGIGIEQNLAESYKWFALAAEQGDQEAAKKRDEVAERLDETALNTAQVAVQTFNAVPQPEQAVGLRAPVGGWDRGTANSQPQTTPATPRVKPPGTEPVPNSLLSPTPL